jgi:hypothetical protein
LESAAAAAPAPAAVDAMPNSSATELDSNLEHETTTRARYLKRSRPAPSDGATTRDAEMAASDSSPVTRITRSRCAAFKR